MNKNALKSMLAQPPATEVFLACRYELWTALLGYDRWSYLHRTPWLAERLKPWELVIAFALTFAHFFFRKKPHMVDRFQFNGHMAETWLVPVYRWQLRIANWANRPKGILKYVGLGMAYLIQRKMVYAAKYLRQKGKLKITFGAACKDQGLTGGGKLYAKVLNGNRPILMHGDTLTAAANIRQIERLASVAKLPKEVFLTGATSKTGRIVALKLAEDGFTVHMCTETEARFDAIKAEADLLGFGDKLKLARKYEDGREVAFWIIGKDKDGEGLVKNMPFGAFVFVYAVPDPLDRKILDSRPDITHVDGGLLEYRDSDCSLSFTMRLRRPLTYACHAWMLTCLANEISEDEIDQVDNTRLDEFWGAAERAGFKLPRFTSHLVEKEIPTYQPGGDRPKTPAAGFPLRTVA